MNHAAVMAGLVPGQSAFLFQQQQRTVPVVLFQLPGSGQSNDSAADDDEIVIHGCSIRAGPVGDLDQCIMQAGLKIRTDLGESHESCLV